MNTSTFPKITTVVQAKPWAAGHVARVTSYRTMSTEPKQPRIIESQVLPR